MIRADLHSHTKYSHGADEPEEMFAAANARGLEILGFSEHTHHVRKATIIPTSTGKNWPQALRNM